MGSLVGYLYMAVAPHNAGAPSKKNGAPSRETFM